MKGIRPIVLALVAQVPSAPAVEVPVPESPSFAARFDRTEFSHDLWDAFLADRVDRQGLVDYQTARKDDRLQEYLFRLAKVDPAGLPDSDHRKALWINAYNALAIQGVLETLPAAPSAVERYSVIDLPIEGLPPGKGFFQGLRFVVGQRRYTLDEIEKRLLLRRWKGLDTVRATEYRTLAPDDADPRIHFALVCCAVGCPPLQRFAYRAEKIDAQLDSVTRGFVSDRARSRFDLPDHVWHVSELLDWYGSDFAGASAESSTPGLFGFAATHVEDRQLANSLRYDQWRTEFIKYEWRLNIVR